MKKVMSLVLLVALLSATMPILPAHAEQGTVPPKIFDEILRLDFDNLAEKGHFAAGETPNTTAFDAGYGGIASLRSTTSSYSYAVVSRDEDPNDKCIELKQTDVVTGDGNSVSEGTTTLQIAVPTGALGLNKGIFKIAYDLKLPSTSFNKPFIRTKTHHGEPAAGEPWGPCLNAIAPINEDGTLDYDDKDPTTVYGTFSTRAYEDGNSAESHHHFTTDYEEKVELPLGKWISVEILMDTDNKKIDYYYDGVYLGTQSGETFAERYLLNPFTPKYVQIQVYQGWRAYSGCQLDNVTFSKLSSAAEAPISTNVSAVDVAEDLTSLTVYSEVADIQSVKVIDCSSAEEVPHSYLVAGNRITLNFPNALSQNGTYTVYLNGKDEFGGVSVKLGSGAVVNQAKLEGISLELKDDNGGLLGAGDTVTATAQLRNGTGEVRQAQLFIAIYNDEIFSQALLKNLSIDEMLTEDSMTITIEDGTSVKVRAFLWEDLDPLIQDVEYEYLPELFRTELDFETEDVKFGFDSVSGNAIVVDGTLFLESDGGNTSLIKNFPKTIRDDVLHLQFNYLTLGYINKFIVYMQGSGPSAKLLYDGGTLGYYPDITSWDMDDERAAYIPNEWMQIDVYLDFESRVVYWYKDDVLYGSTYMPESLKDLSKVTFLNEDSQSDIYFDNVIIETLRDSDPALPAEIREEVLIDMTSDHTGHIFFEKENAAFQVKVKNKDRYGETYILKYSVKDESGNTVYTNQKTVSMAGREVQTFTITANSGGYGYYHLVSELYSQGGRLITKGLDYKFSVANAPKNGEQDSNMGVQFATRYTLDANDGYLELPLMDRLGFGVVRGGAVKFELVDAEGNLPYDKWRALWYETCRDKGFDLLGAVAYNNPNITAENPPRSPEALKAFAKFAVDYCAFYEQMYGTPPKDIEVWNEYYLTGTAFNPDKTTPADYANMLVAVYNAVKDKYPTVKVWGMSGVGFGEFDWTEQVLKALPKDGKKYMDGVAVHPYANTQTPEDADYVTFVKDYKALFQKYGHEDVDFYATEWGWPSVGKYGFPDEEQQAANFVRGNVINVANKLFDKISWYAFNDVGLYNDDKENRFGFVKGAYAQIGYEAKPLFLMAANYQNLMIGAEFVQSIKLSDEVTAYQFKLRGGEDAVVLWANKNPETVSLNLGTSQIRLLDAYGNEQAISQASGTYTIETGISPSYLIGSFTQLQ